MSSVAGGIADKIGNCYEYNYYIFDDVIGIIRLHKNRCTDKLTTITRRNILVTDKARESMNKERTGYYNNKATHPFTGSYISRDEDPETYERWKKVMAKRYSEFKVESKKIYMDGDTLVGYQGSIFDND